MIIDPLEEYFEPDAARVMRALFDHEFARIGLPAAPQPTPAPVRGTPLSRAAAAEKSRQADQAFAEEEAGVKAKFREYDGNRRAILQYAIEHSIPDLADAVHAWRNSDRPEAVAAREQAAAEQQLSPEETFERIQIRKDELRLMDSPQSRHERALLEQEESDLQDAHVESLIRQANDGHSRKEVEKEIATARQKRESDTAYRTIMGRFRPKDRDEARAEMDLAVEDHVRGRKPITAPRTPRQTESDRKADLHGLDAKDREVLAMVERANARGNAGVASDPMPPSPMNTEVAVETIAAQ